MAAIYQLPTPIPAMVDVLPAFKFMVTNDSQVSLTTPGYMNAVDLQSNPLTTGDILQVLYSYDLQTKIGTYGFFTVSINNGIITLNSVIEAGTVTWQTPVIPGDFVTWVTDGVINDLGYSPTNATFPKVVMAAATVKAIGDIATFADASGSIQDSGVLIADLININNTSSFSGSTAGLFFTNSQGTESLGAVTLNSQAGTITTSSLSTPPGGTYAFTCVNPYVLSSSSVVMLTLQAAGTNTVGYDISLSFSVGAGGFVVNVLNNNALALNGTVVMSFFIVA